MNDVFLASRAEQRSAPATYAILKADNVQPSYATPRDSTMMDISNLQLEQGMTQYGNWSSSSFSRIINI